MQLEINRNDTDNKISVSIQNFYFILYKNEQCKIFLWSNVKKV